MQEVKYMLLYIDIYNYMLIGLSYIKKCGFRSIRGIKDDHHDITISVSVLL